MQTAKLFPTIKTGKKMKILKHNSSLTHKEGEEQILKCQSDRQADLYFGEGYWNENQEKIERRVKQISLLSA